jgi:hypothetical protein
MVRPVPAPCANAHDSRGERYLSGGKNQTIFMLVGTSPGDIGWKGHRGGAGLIVYEALGKRKKEWFL